MTNNVNNTTAPVMQEQQYVSPQTHYESQFSPVQEGRMEQPHAIRAQQAQFYMQPQLEMRYKVC